MFQAVVASYGYPKFHVLGPEGEIRVANVPLKDALRLAALLEAGLVADAVPTHCAHGKENSDRCHICWMYS